MSAFKDFFTLVKFYEDHGFDSPVAVEKAEKHIRELQECESLVLLIVLFFKCSIFLDFNKLVEKVEAEKTVKIEAMKLEAVKVEAEKTIKIEAMNLEGAKEQR